MIIRIDNAAQDLKFAALSHDAQAVATAALELNAAARRWQAPAYCQGSAERATADAAAALVHVALRLISTNFSEEARAQHERAHSNYAATLIPFL